jgi:hypothetical protein
MMGNAAFSLNKIETKYNAAVDSDDDVAGSHPAVDDISILPLTILFRVCSVRSCGHHPYQCQSFQQDIL